MNILEVIKYCKDNNVATIPELQVKYGLTYKETKSIVDKLVAEGELAYDCGIRYSYIGNFGDLHEIEFDESKEAARRLEDRRLYLEAHKRELDNKMRRLFSDKDDDDDEEDEGGDELRFKVLKVCIEKGAASTSLIQRVFPIGYLRACKLIDWMEDKGYVSPAQGAIPRKVLITIEEFNKIFNDTN